MEKILNMERFHQFCDKNLSKMLSSSISPSMKPVARWEPYGAALYCVVCGDPAAGRHYGVISCAACRSFFMRSMQKQSVYKCLDGKECEGTKGQRHFCQYCRLQKCISVGMFTTDSIQASFKQPTDENSASTTNKNCISKASEILAKSADYEENCDLDELESQADGDVLFHLETTSSPEKIEKILNMESFHRFCDENRSKMMEANIVAQSDDATSVHCVVCGDRASGRHYGAISCEGCCSFFKRSMRMQLAYKCQRVMNCEVTKEQRARCQYCRLQKCISVGMVVSDSTPSKRKQPTDVDSSSTTSKNLISKTFEELAKSADYEEENSIFYVLEGPLLTDQNVSFHLEATSSPDVLLSAQYISESASRLLFLSVHWTRSITAFKMLSSDTQKELVRGCWTELFALGLAQCSDIIQLPAILTTILTQLRAHEKVSVQRIKLVTELVIQIQDYVNTMSKLQVDENEYAYLKAIALFSPDHAETTSRLQVKHFHDKATKELRTYVKQTWNNEDRFPRLLLRLSPIRSLQSDLVEELFFGALIGQVRIDSVIPFILTMDQKTDYNGEADQVEVCLIPEISM